MLDFWKGSAHSVTKEILMNYHVKMTFVGYYRFNHLLVFSAQTVSFVQTDYAETIAAFSGLGDIFQQSVKSN